MAEVLMAAIAAAIAADVQHQVTAVADIPLPTAAAIRRRAATVAERHTEAVDLRTVVDPRTVAAVAADMGGNTALDSIPA